MGEVRADTVAALGERFTIFAFCLECRRDARLDTRRLVAVYGPALTISELRERVTCNRCGSRTRELRIVCTAPGGSETEHSRST
jgi:hypothetical protein